MAEECTHKVKQLSHNLYALQIYWKTSGTGTFTANTVINKPINGRIICVDTIPGSTAPTNAYDIDLKNADGIEVMEGYLHDRSDTNPERAYPLKGVTEKVPIEPPVNDCLDLTITNNSVNDADGYINVYFERDESAIG